MRIRLIVGAVLVALALVSGGSVVFPAVPQAVSYQAVLTANGTPVTTPVTVVFTIYDAALGGAAVWTETRSVTPDAQGRVNVRLGENAAIDDAVFSAANRWLGVRVGADAEMSPRMPLASSSYAFRTATIDGAKGGEVSGDLVLRSTAAKDGMAAEARIIFLGDLGDSLIFGPADAVLFKATDPAGEERMSAVVDPVAGAMLSIRQDGTEAAEHVAGQSSYFSAGAAKNPAALSERVRVSDEGVACFGATVEDVTVRVDAASGKINAYRATFGLNNTVSVAAGKDANGLPLSPDPGLVAGDNNTLTGSNASAIGDGNFVSGANSIAVGTYDSIFAENCIVAGRDHYVAANQSSVFGFDNYVSGGSQIMCAGHEDTLTNSPWGSLLGGHLNALHDAHEATIGGGKRNQIISAGICGIFSGQYNTIKGSGYSVIAGGQGNTISIDDNGGSSFVEATISGGNENTASNSNATVAGGLQNLASGAQSTIGGGSNNDATGHQSTVAGGIVNAAGPGNGTTVSGGESNTASGNWATVPGGYGNIASGVKSFAAGYEAQAGHDGAFVWADATGGGVYSSTGSNQFLIKAAGGVGINTNAPTSTLHVEGAISTKVVSTSGNYSMGGESVVLANAPLAGLTVTIPSASSCSGRQVTVKKLDNLGTVTVATSGGTIDGGATYTLAVQYDFVSMVSDGSNWFVVSR